MAEEQQQIFSIEKIYVKDLSLEVPSAPEVFLNPEQPQLEVQLGQGAQAVAEGLVEATLSVTVTARAGEKTLFLVEVSQAGIFQIRGFSEAELGGLLAVVCPNVLFPYARETISDMVTRSGFPPVLLAPVNFEALAQQQAAQQDDGPRIEIAH